MKQVSDFISGMKHQLEINFDDAIATTKQTTESIIATGTDALQQAKQGVEGTTKTLDEWQATIAGLTASGTDTVNMLEDLSRNAQALVGANFDQAIATTKQTAESVVAAGTDMLQQAKQGIEETAKTLDGWQAAIAGSAASGMEIANALKDLPRTAQALTEEMPKLAQRLKTAGIRVGESPRSDADVVTLFNKIPGTSKLGASEWDIRLFLSDKHGSHVYPHSRGGGNGASNIVWELGVDNIRRGARVMTGGEQIYIRFYNAVDSILKNSTTIARLGASAVGTAVLTQAVVITLAYTLDLYRGDITAEEFRDKVANAAIAAGITTPVFFLVFIAAIALCPEVSVVLSAPTVVAGFNALFGVSIALPIIQSIIRHVGAGGFVQKADVYYRSCDVVLDSHTIAPPCDRSGACLHWFAPSTYLDLINRATYHKLFDKRVFKVLGNVLVVCLCLALFRKLSKIINS